MGSAGHGTNYTPFIAFGAVLMMTLMVTWAASRWANRHWVLSRSMTQSTGGAGGALAACARRVSCGTSSTFSLGEAFLVGAYAVASAGHVLLKWAALDDEFALARAFGSLTMINLALVTLPTTRTSIWVVLFGVPFERCVRYHRVLARWTLLNMWLHGAQFVLGKGEDVLSIDNPSHPPLYGLAAAGLFTVMGLLAIETVRRRYFELFRYSHWLFVPAFILAILHTKLLAAYGVPAAALYAFDRVMRWRRSRLAWPVARATREGYVLELVLERPPSFAFTAGQYCFVRIPTISALQWHPLSISSSPQDRMLTFHIRSAEPGSWSSNAVERHATIDTIRVDGPLGRMPLNLESYSSVVFVAGGVGITPIASMINDLLASTSAATASQMPRMVLIWRVKTPSMFMMWLELLKVLDRHHRCTLHLSCSMVLPADSSVVAALRSPIEHPRPPIADIIKRASTSPGQIGVVGCGPVGMVATTRDAAASNHADFHAETFLL